MKDFINILGERLDILNMQAKEDKTTRHREAFRHRCSAGVLFASPLGRVLGGCH